MNKPQLIAQAEALNRRARELWQESTALTVAEYEALGLDTSRIGPDYVCAAGAPLRAESTALREKARQLFEQANGRAPASAVTPIVTTTKPDLSPEVEGIVARALAASHLVTPVGSASSSVAAPTAAELALCEAEAHEYAIDARVSEILGDPSYLARSEDQRKARAAERAADQSFHSRSAAREAAIAETAARIAAA